MVSERRQHRDERVVSICQGKSAECVEDVNSVGDGWKQPVEAVFADALREKCDDLKKPLGVRAKIPERRGGERELDRGRKTLFVLCVEYVRSPSLPFPRQSGGIPLVVLGNGSE